MADGEWVDAGKLTSRIITRDEIGRAMPYGWAVEQSGFWYTPFLGDEVQLAPVRSLQGAIISVRAFLASSVANASRTLADSLLYEQESFLDEVKGGKRSDAGPPAASQTLDPKAT